MKIKSLKSFRLHFVFLLLLLSLASCNHIEPIQTAKSNDTIAVSPETVVSDYVKAAKSSNSSEIKNLIVEPPQSYWSEKVESFTKSDEEYNEKVTVDPNYSQPKLGKFIYEQMSVDFPEFINKYNLKINSIPKVTTNGNKCRVNLVFESESDASFVNSMKAEKNFYLYKTEAGWKIFEIMDVGDTSDFPY